MYCPKCTLEIKGEDQTTCPICNSALVETPVESSDATSEEDLKLQELIADIDGKVSGTNDDLEAAEEPAFSIGEDIDSEPGSGELEDPSADPMLSDLDLGRELDTTSVDSEVPDPEISLDLDDPSSVPSGVDSGLSLELEDQPLEASNELESSPFSLEGEEPQLSLDDEP